jgi:hypothetical protein
MPTHHYPLERLRWPCGFVVRPAGTPWSDLRRAVQGGKSLTPVKWIPQRADIVPLRPAPALRHNSPGSPTGPSGHAATRGAGHPCARQGNRPSPARRSRARRPQIVRVRLSSPAFAFAIIPWKYPPGEERK